MKRRLAFVAAAGLLACGLMGIKSVRMTVLWLIAGAADALGFESEVTVPERPASVPKTAVWAGGVDGGAWIQCVLDDEKNANWCTTWSDQTGEVTARTYFILRDTGKPVQGNDLIYSSFTGTYIVLADGRMLEPVKFHGVERDPWEHTPIDSPRAGLDTDKK